MYEQTIQTLNSYLAKGIFPGYSVAFLNKDQVTTYVKGYTQLTPVKEQLQHHFFYDLASVSKVFVTATILAQLIEQQKVDLDWQVCRFFPKMKEKHVTIRHLVTHTSGLRGYIPNRDKLSAEQLVDALVGLSCDQTVGHIVQYTDTGFVLAGKLIEKIVQQPLADYFATQITQPLGIAEMCYGPLPPERCVPTEWVAARGGLIRGVVHDPKASVLKRSCGSAGLFATLSAMIDYTRMLLNGGVGQNGKRILNETTISSLFSDWTPTKKAKRSLGWQLQTVGKSTWLRHTGFTGTAVLWNYDRQQAFILLSNRILTYPNTAKYNEFRDQLIDTFLRETSY